MEEVWWLFDLGTGDLVGWMPSSESSPLAAGLLFAMFSEFPSDPLRESRFCSNLMKMSRRARGSIPTESYSGLFSCSLPLVGCDKKADPERFGPKVV